MLLVDGGNDMASRSIRLGEAKIAVSGGTENMSRVPYFLTAQRWGHTLGDVPAQGPARDRLPDDRQAARACRRARRPRNSGSRARQQDAWAVRSHMNYLAARDAGKFADEILPIAVPQPEG